MPVTAKFQAAGATDPGLQRENNEDRFHYDADRGIFLVVDGMGGQAAGEMAAEIAVSMLRARLERQTGAPAERIREAIAIANNEIFRLSQSNAALSGMACVLTVAVIEDGRATIGHVGDSRLYLLQPAGITKITRDHSPVGEREERNELSEREAMAHPRRNEVYRDVGSAEHSPDDADFIDITEIEFPPDHALLLCSDGLSDLLTSSEIRKVTERNAGSPWSAAKALIAAANDAGGKDNVTVVVIEGSDYGAAVGSDKRSTGEEPAAPRPGNPLIGRWAFFLYGLLLGALLAGAVAQRLGHKLPSVSGPEQPATAARTWVVGPAESADAGTISAALAKANAGDTIVVAPGDYNEVVQLKDGVNLVSQRLHGATIRPTAQGIAVLAEGVRSGQMGGFRIEGDAVHPLTVGLDLKDAALDVHDLQISGARGAAIEIRGRSECMLRANHIVNNPGTGIIIRDISSPRLAHNLISGNGKGERIPRPGVDVRDEAKPLLYGNTIVDNAAEPVWVSPGYDATPVTSQNFFGAARPGGNRRFVRLMQR